MFGVARILASFNDTFVYVPTRLAARSRAGQGVLATAAQHGACRPPHALDALCLLPPRPAALSPPLVAWLAPAPGVCCPAAASAWCRALGLVPPPLLSDAGHSFEAGRRLTAWRQAASAWPTGRSSRWVPLRPPAGPEGVRVSAPGPDLRAAPRTLRSFSSVHTPPEQLLHACCASPPC